MEHTIDTLPKQIDLGNQGESGILNIDLDCTTWLTDFPTGTIAATFILPDTHQAKLLPETQAYMLPDDVTFRIIVKRNMTLYAGKGSLNIRLVIDGDDVEKRSAVVGTYTAPSHSTSAEEMPVDVEDWVDAAIAKLAEVDQSILEMEETEFASAAFVGDDLVLTKENGTTIILVGAKTALTGPPGTTGASIVSAAFDGDDIDFTKDDASVVTLIDAAITLKGDPGVDAELPLNFRNVVVETTDWTASTTYPGYEFEAAIPCTGVTADMFAEIVLAHEDSLSYNYSPACLTGSGTVTVYAMVVPSADITIPLIRVVTV